MATTAALKQNYKSRIIIKPGEPMRAKTRSPQGSYGGVQEE